MSLSRLPSVFGTQKSPSSAPSQDAHHHSVLNTFRAQIKSGVSGVIDHSLLSGVLDALTHGDAIDDRKLLLENALALVSNMPQGSISKNLQDNAIKLFYNDLPHPTATYVGDKYAWRSADGSGNNVDLPTMGMAGMPYSRSVQQIHALPKNSLPDSGLIFDTLLKRDEFVEHPAGLSSLMFSFAALVIHSVFRTSHTDPNINETSSYVDLAPLYGNSQVAQDKLRVRDGRGLLYPDVFAEDRLLLLPPAVCVILVLFSRNHNYIAKKLLEINEQGTWVDPATLTSEDPTKNQRLLVQEEQIFQTARLINCAWFAGVVFSDYVSAILGLVRDGNTWGLNPFDQMRLEDHSMFPRGEGNVCSVEFNCLYRWHATTSVDDEKWVEAIFAQIFPGKTADQITPMDFKATAQKLQDSEPDVQHWTFGRLQRQTNGAFKDSELANTLKNSTDHPAGAFKARGTPAIMRLHEMMGIEQSRRSGICSMNDFRRFLGLKPFASFKEWNPKPEIYEAAEKLYGDIERLELYVGLQAEEAKPVVEGAGLCPGYTISRAILSDAITLTRGDRFYTTDFTPFNLTAWGFADCQRQPSGSGFGSMLGRLFLRTLPQDFTSNSVYAWFPLMTPTSMKTNLRKLNLINKYDFTRPGTRSVVSVVKEYAEVGQILSDTVRFQPPYAARAAVVIKGNGFFLASADSARGKQEQQEVLSALVPNSEAASAIGQFFFNKTRELITLNSYALVGGKTRCADVARDVLKYVPVHWAATEIAGIHLKTKETPHGVYTPEQLFGMLSDIYSFVFLDVEPYKLMVLEDAVRGHVEELLRHIKSNLGSNQRMSVVNIVGSFFHKSKKNNQCHEFIKHLHNIGHSSDQLANTILAIMVGFTVELSLVLTNVLNVYLSSSHDAEVRGLAAQADSKGQLDPYILEALRIDPPFQGVHRVVQEDTTIGSLQLRKDDHVFLDIGHANFNDKAFTNAETIVPGRKAELYLNGAISVRCLGTDLTCKVGAEVLRAVYSFPNVRRGPGQSGTLTRFPNEAQMSHRYSYLDSHQFTAPWPTSFVIQYDA